MFSASRGRPGDERRSRAAQSPGIYSVELDSIDERALVDRSCVRGPLAESLAVRLAGSSDVLAGDGREGDKLNGVDLDFTGSHAVATALPDPWQLPQPDRERDVSGQDIVPQFAAELHSPDGSG